MTMTMPEVRYRTLNKSDEKIVSSFVAKHYLPFETTVKYSNLNDYEIDTYARCFSVSFTDITT